MTTPMNPPPTPGFGARLGQAIRVFLRTLARLLLILLVFALIGLAIYYGVPAAYSRFIEPVQNNTFHMQSLQTSQAQENQQVLQTLTSAQNRLGTLEAQHAADSQTIATLQAHVNNLDSSTGDAANQLKASTVRLNALDSSINQISIEMSVLTTTLKMDETTLQGLVDKIQAGDPAVKSLEQELQLLKGMELITRSRLFLGQNNLGLAQQDVQAAYDLLNQLQNQVPPYQTDAVAAVVQRLKLVLVDLPGTPVLAADDLEIAWQLLVRGLPGKTAEAAAANLVTATPVITTTITNTITMTVAPSATFTPAATLTPLTGSTVIPASVTPTP